MKKKRLFLILSLIACQVATGGLMAMDNEKHKNTPCDQEAREQKKQEEEDFDLD